MSHENHNHCSSGSPEELLALLKYMSNHNASHTHELEHLMKNVKNDDATELIKRAVNSYQDGNALLEGAIEILEK